MMEMCYVNRTGLWPKPTIMNRGISVQAKSSSGPGLCLWAGFLFLLLIFSTCWAQQSGAGPESVQQEAGSGEDREKPVLPRLPGISGQTGRFARPEIALDSIHVTRAGVDGGPGDYAMTRARVAVEFERFAVGYTRRAFSWYNVDRLPFGDGRQDPWETLHALEVQAKFKGDLWGNWRYYFSGELSSLFEKEFGPASLDMLAALGYDFSSRFKVRAGAAIFVHRVRTIVVPVFAFKWWAGGLNADKPLFSVSAGLPESTITYHYSDALTLTSFLLVDSKVFRLADDSIVQEGGFAETRDIIIGLRFNYSPFKNATISLGGGYDFFRELNIYDSDGHEQGSYDVQGAWSGRVRLGINF